MVVYEKKTSWYLLPLSSKYKTDLFIIYPSQVSDPKKQKFLSLNDKQMGKGVKSWLTQLNLKKWKANIFCPKYNQLNLAFLSEKEKSFKTPAYLSINEAWNYYFSHLNKGRKVVIISHSQGTDLLGKILLNNNIKKYKKLIKAVFAIGCDFDEKIGDIKNIYQWNTLCNDDTDSFTINKTKQKYFTPPFLSKKNSYTSKENKLSIFTTPSGKYTTKTNFISAKVVKIKKAYAIKINLDSKKIYSKDQIELMKSIGLACGHFNDVGFFIGNIIALCENL